MWYRSLMLYLSFIETIERIGCSQAIKLTVFKCDVSEQKQTNPYLRATRFNIVFFCNTFTCMDNYIWQILIFQ